MRAGGGGTQGEGEGAGPGRQPGWGGATKGEGEEAGPRRWREQGQAAPGRRRGPGGGARHSAGGRRSGDTLGEGGVAAPPRGRDVGREPWRGGPPQWEGAGHQEPGHLGELLEAEERSSGRVTWGGTCGAWASRGGNLRMGGAPEDAPREGLGVPVPGFRGLHLLSGHFCSALLGKVCSGERWPEGWCEGSAAQRKGTPQSWWPASKGGGEEPGPCLQVLLCGWSFPAWSGPSRCLAYFSPAAHGTALGRGPLFWGPGPSSFLSLPGALWSFSFWVTYFLPQSPRSGFLGATPCSRGSLVFLL